MYVIAALLVVAATALVAAQLMWTKDPSSPETLARERAEAFLDEYVTAQGRVVRWDHGGDTVSEGQGYGMLLAVIAGDEDRFEAIWSWTSDELQRDDGLLSWHWQDGKVVDQMSASDADLEAAWALLLAAERFNRPAWRDEALHLGDAILDVLASHNGQHTVLTAGPWASGDPVIINPSYFIPAAFEDLGRASGDERWPQLWDSSQQLLVDLTDRGRRLPPDWAVLSPTGAQAVDEPDGSGPGQYGLDASRIPLRLASSCAAEDRALAAALFQRIDELEDGGARIAYSLTGEPMSDSVNPLGMVAAAAGAAAAGEEADAHALLERADRLAEAHPSYYGQAWTALGRALLTTSLVGNCPGLR